MKTPVMMRLIGSTALALCLSVQAGLAQSSETDPEAVAVEDLSVDTEVLDAIVVTARRVNETLQQTPVAVSVQTADDMGPGKVERMHDLNQAVPNAMIGNGNGGPVMVIRGVGNQSFGGLDTQHSVGLFIDDIYVGRSFAVPSFLSDLGRVEVVRGSQATLYGKNTIGGAINFVTNDPSDEPEGMLSVSYGTDNLRKVQASVDAPILNNNILTRTFLSYSARDGDIKNLTTGKDEFDANSFGGRFVAQTNGSEDTRARFTFDLERVNDGSDQSFSPIKLALQHKTEHDYPAYQKITRGGLSLKLEKDFEAFDVISNTGVRFYDAALELDGDYGKNPPAWSGKQGQFHDQHQISQEIRVKSKDKDRDAQQGDLNWMLGAYFLYDELSGHWLYDSIAVPAGSESRNYVDTVSKTYSLFGNANYNLTDDLQLNAGLRYTFDTKRSDIEVTSPMGTNALGTPYKHRGTISFHNLSPEIGAQYNVTPDDQIYARISRGFKAGGISQFQDPSGKANTYDPEISWNYELGAKTSWMDDRLRVNVSGFYTDWKDLQTLLLLNASSSANYVANASSATSKGFEIEAFAQLSDALTVSANYGYVKAQYDKYVDPRKGTDYSGNPMPLAPEHSAGAGVNWIHDLDNGMTIEADMRYTYRSPYTFDPLALYKQKPLHLVSADLSATFGDWKASVWGKNLLNRKYVREYFYTSGNHVGVAEKGRVVGLTLSKKW